MKKIYLYLLSFCLVLFAGFNFTSCVEELEGGLIEEDTGALSIKVYSPTRVIPGQEVVITGTGFDNLEAIVFPGDVSVTEYTRVATHMLKVITPTGINSEGGELKLRGGGNEAVARIAMTLGKPSIKTLAPNDTIQMGKELQIMGEDLEFIRQVIFPGGVYDEDGKVVEGEKGEDVIVELDKFTFVSPKKLTLKVPKGCYVGESIIKLLAVDGTIHNSAPVIFAEPITGEWVTKEFVLWEGRFDLGVWANNWEVDWEIFLKKEAEAAALGIEMKVGTVVRLYFEPTAENWQMKFNDGRWGANYGYLSGGYTITQENAEENGITSNYYDIIVDDGILPFWNGEDHAANYWGNALIINGENIVFSKIVIPYEEWVEIGDGPQEVVAWEGTFDLGAWSNNWEVPCSIFEGLPLQVGTVVTLHYETTGDWWQFKINDGNWGSDYGYLGGGYTVSPNNHEDNTSFEIIVDSTILGWLDGSRVAASGWGSALIINGESVIFNKITVK